MSRRTMQEVLAWLQDPRNSSEARGLDVTDGESGWVPLLAHPRFVAFGLAAAENEPGVPPVPDRGRAAPPIPTDE